ncbi:MAG: hypothetical protein ACJA2W_003887 [Planctomycetota bacterium]|jgi:hypothetical protein
MEAALDYLLMPARVVAPMGGLSRPFAGTFHREPDEKTRAEEEALSLRLERAVLRSAWPQETAIPGGVVAIPGEVDARKGNKRDHIMVRVADASDIRLDHPVVAGDVYVGRVERIPFRQVTPDQPGLVERLLRRLRLSSAPPLPPRNVVEVALITGARERVGGNVLEDQDGRACRLVVGGLSPRLDRNWLAAHNPESRATRSGTVVVMEPYGRVHRFDSLAEGFLLGEMKEEPYQREGEGFVRNVLGIQPPLDFESGLNQVLVLTDTASARLAAGQPGPLRRALGSFPATRRLREAAGSSAVPVLGAARWLPVRLFGFGDTAPWRCTGRLNLGVRSGLRVGAAIVSGVRLVGRVARSGAGGATVAFMTDPGFEVAVLAQAVDAPDAEPLVLGNIRSLGRSGEAIRFEWNPEGSSLQAAWCAKHAPDGAAGADGVRVRLWTGSGLVATPRGLLVGSTTLPLEVPDGGSVPLDIVDSGSPGGDLLVRAGARSSGDAAAGGNR